MVLSRLIFSIEGRSLTLLERVVSRSVVAAVVRETNDAIHAAACAGSSGSGNGDWYV